MNTKTLDELLEMGGIKSVWVGQNRITLPDGSLLVENDSGDYEIE
jgi:hypothetical protein